jgi:biotin carboxyl carrier protein
MKYSIEIANHRLELEIHQQSQAEAIAEIGGQRKRVELRRVGENYVLLLEGRTIGLGISGHHGNYRVQLAGHEYEVHVERALLQKYKQFLNQTQGRSSGGTSISAPMPGLILKVEAKPGQHVRVGDKLVIIDAMKMENEIRATQDGIIERVNVQEKQQVEKGHLLCVIRQSSGGS